MEKSSSCQGEPFLLAPSIGRPGVLTPICLNLMATYSSDISGYFSPFNNPVMPYTDQKNRLPDGAFLDFTYSSGWFPPIIWNTDCVGNYNNGSFLDYGIAPKLKEGITICQVSVLLCPEINLTGDFVLLQCKPYRYYVGGVLFPKGNTDFLIERTEDHRQCRISWKNSFSPCSGIRCALTWDLCWTMVLPNHYQIRDTPQEMELSSLDGLPVPFNGEFALCGCKLGSVVVTTRDLLYTQVKTVNSALFSEKVIPEKEDTQKAHNPPGNRRLDYKSRFTSYIECNSWRSSKGCSSSFWNNFRDWVLFQNLTCNGKVYFPSEMVDRKRLEIDTDLMSNQCFYQNGDRNISIFTSNSSSVTDESTLGVVNILLVCFSCAFAGYWLFSMIRQIRKSSVQILIRRQEKNHIQFQDL